MSHIVASAIVCSLFLFNGCTGNSGPAAHDDHDLYRSGSRLTDPGQAAGMLAALPDDLGEICDIANVQLTHYTMLSQWKVPRSEWKLANSGHDIVNILDTLRARGNGTLSASRQLNDRILGACTKESIFSTSILRYKGYAARIRVGYLTNLYKGEKAIEFWRNVNNYGNPVPLDSAKFDDFTAYMREVNKSIEHWVTEYWDDGLGRWRVLDIRPEYLRSYGLETGYHLADEHFEFGWEAWKKIDEPDFKEDAYAEGDLDAKSHIRYQMLMDFYCLLNHDVPGLFDDDGVYSRDPRDTLVYSFLRKKYADLTPAELRDLDALADLIGSGPTVRKLIGFYEATPTLQIGSMDRDRYSFISRKKEILADA